MPIDPIQAIGAQALRAPGLGDEFRIPSLAELGDVEATPATDSAGFGGALQQQLHKLGELNASASAQSQALAAGEATDVSSVVLEVERAALAMQLAVQVRNRAVEAYQDLWRMQI